MEMWLTACKTYQTTKNNYSTEWLLSYKLSDKRIFRYDQADA